MKKAPFITKQQAEEISKKYPTPFYLYDEKGIRENAEPFRRLFHGIKISKSILQ